MLLLVLLYICECVGIRHLVDNFIILVYVFFFIAVKWSEKEMFHKMYEARFARHMILYDLLHAIIRKIWLRLDKNCFYWSVFCQGFAPNFHLQCSNTDRKKPFTIIQ